MSGLAAGTKKAAAPTAAAVDEDDAVDTAGAPAGAAAPAGGQTDAAKLGAAFNNLLGLPGADEGGASDVSGTAGTGTAVPAATSIPVTAAGSAVPAAAQSGPAVANGAGLGVAAAGSAGAGKTAIKVPTAVRSVAKAGGAGAAALSPGGEDAEDSASGLPGAAAATSGSGQAAATSGAAVSADASGALTAVSGTLQAGGAAGAAGGDAGAAAPPVPIAPGVTAATTSATAAALAESHALAGAASAQSATALATNDDKHSHGVTDQPALDGGSDAAAGLFQLTPTAAGASTDAAATTPTLQVHANVDSGEFAQGLSDRVSYMVDNGLNGAKLQVNPPQLGPIELRIAVSGGHAQVWMTTHSAVTRDALESSSPKLREMLGAQGFGQVSVDISQRSFQERSTYAQSYERSSTAANNATAAVTSPAGSGPRATLGVVDAYA